MIKDLKRGRDEALQLVARFKKLRDHRDLREWNEYRKAKKERFQEELDGILEELQDLTKKFDAAKRAIGLTNKLPKDDEKRSYFRSKAFGHLNRFRAAIRRLEKSITVLEREFNYE